MFTICIIAIEPLGPWIEVILGRFMRAYATDGGFGTTWPGLCPRLAGSSTGQQITYMEETNTWIEANTPIDANAKIEVARCTAYCARDIQQKKSDFRRRIDKRLEKQKSFIEAATEAHRLVEKDRTRGTGWNPELVKSVDKAYEDAQELLNVQKRRDQLP
jgi:hypothetical protein